MTAYILSMDFRCLAPTAWRIVWLMKSTQTILFFYMTGIIGKVLEKA